MREFSTGATRDTNEGKPDYAGYLSPLVIKRFGQYMLEHQVQADGKRRSSSNWKLGMPQNEYISSMFRHFMAVWSKYENGGSGIENDLCALMFNVMGYLHEELKRFKIPVRGFSEPEEDGDLTVYETSTGRFLVDEKGMED